MFLSNGFLTEFHKIPEGVMVGAMQYLTTDAPTVIYSHVDLGVFMISASQGVYINDDVDFEAAFFLIAPILYNMGCGVPTTNYQELFEARQWFEHQGYIFLKNEYFTEFERIMREAEYQSIDAECVA